MKTRRLTAALLVLAAVLLFVVASLILQRCERRLTSQPPSTPSALSGQQGQPTCAPGRLESEASLGSIDPPPADPYDLAVRLKHSTPPVAGDTPVQPRPYAPGDVETFQVLHLDQPASFQVRATLRHVTPVLYLWVQEGLEVSQDALEQSAQAFEERICPTVRGYFGSEWSPGVDNDVRLSVLNVRFSGGSGYFSSSDEYPSSYVPSSNQREMFYINPDYELPGTPSYESTLAHEFQHMVHWFADPNEDAWVNEGASELAAHLCGYSRADSIAAFVHNPDVQLNHWHPPPDSGRHYAASFLFMTYFAERFGPQATRDLVAEKQNGIAGFNAVLSAHNTDLDLDGLFADWAVANYLDARRGPAPGDVYAYQCLDVGVDVERTIVDYPAQGDGTVHQYAADYFELFPAAYPLEVELTGTSTARLVPNQAHSGRYQWWSNHGDNSDMTLTRSFDLRGLHTATLEAWLWYDIEEGWDYAYVEASSDGGRTWDILPGKHSTTANPSGNSYGPGFTGVSGSDPARGAQWVLETLDLSPYAGQQVLVRFEYITDEVFTRPGLCVDDVCIPELGFCDDAELGEDEWLAQGFVRTDNTLPQDYILQLIEMGPSIRVERLHVTEGTPGTLIVPSTAEGVGKAVLIISAVAPNCTEPASYRYEIRPAK